MIMQTVRKNTESLGDPRSAPLVARNAPTARSNARTERSGKLFLCYLLLAIPVTR